MGAALYFLSAVLLLFVARRVTTFSRWTALALVAVPLIFTGRAFLTPRVLAPVDLAYASEPLASIGARVGVRAVSNPGISDVYAQFVPWKDALRRSIARGEWPLWDPYALCGTPLAGSAQSSPYHPITLLALLIPLRESFAFSAALMLMSTASFAFLFLRDFIRSEIAALFGAIGWMASAHVVFFIGTALVFAASAMPLVLLGARRIVREPSGKSAAILTIGLLLVVLAGHPESALHIVTFAVAYFVFELFTGRAGAPLTKIIVAGIASGVIALLLAAMFLLPVIEVIAQSEEYVHRAIAHPQPVATPARLLHGLGANFFPFLEGSAGVEERPHVSEIRHGWLPTAYAGSMLFAPAIFALIRVRTPQRWFFLGAILWGLAAGLNAPGFAEVLSHIPGFAIAVNDRMIAFAAFGICVLAALGLDSAGGEASLGRTYAVVAIVIAIEAVAVPSGISGNYLRINAARAFLPVALAACALVILPKRAAAVVLVGLVLLQRGGEAGRVQPMPPARAFYPPFPGLSLMQSNEPFRIVATETLLTPESGTHYGLEDVRGFEALTFFRMWETFRLWCVTQPVWSNRVDRLDAPMLSLMNVRWAIVAPDTAIPPWWQIRARFPAYAIAENARVLPRAFVPRSVLIVRSPDESLKALSSIADFGEESVVENGRPASGANGPGIVSVTGIGSHVHLRAQMAAPGWVVISNALWKGWTASEAGRRIPIRFANHAFAALYLDSGEHEIDLIYRPRSFVMGAWISGLTALLLLAYGLMPRTAITFFMSFQTSFLAEGVRSR